MGREFESHAGHAVKVETEIWRVMDIYVVVVHDTIVQSREYVVMVPPGSSPDDAMEKVAKGEFTMESAPTTMETIQTARFSAEKVGSSNEG